MKKLTLVLLLALLTSSAVFMVGGCKGGGTVKKEEIRAPAPPGGMPTKGQPSTTAVPD